MCGKKGLRKQGPRSHTEIENSQPWRDHGYEENAAELLNKKYYICSVAERAHGQGENTIILKIPSWGKRIHCLSENIHVTSQLSMGLVISSLSLNLSFLCLMDSYSLSAPHNFDLHKGHHVYSTISTSWSFSLGSNWQLLQLLSFLGWFLERSSEWPNPLFSYQNTLKWLLANLHIGYRWVGDSVLFSSTQREVYLWFSK